MSTRPMPLRSFCIFHRGLGSSEEDATVQERAEKLLYFFPTSTDVQEKVNLVEIFESFIDFGRMMSLDRDGIHSLSLKDVRYGMSEVESDIWMCIGVNTPGQDSSDTALQQQEETGLASRLYRTIAGSSSSKSLILPPAITAQALRTLLAQTYDSIRFLSGPFSAQTDVAKFRLFLRRIVPSCLSGVCFDTLHCAMIHAVDGVEHLPVDKQVFLTVQSFTELFNSRFPSVQRRIVILHGGMLVWSSLSPHHARSVFKFLSREQPDASDGYMQLGGGAMVEGSGGGHQGSRYIAPRVWFSSESTRIAALKKRKAVLVFFFRPTPSTDQPDDEEHVSEMLQRIHTTMGGEFERICELLEEGTKRVEKETLAEASRRLDSAFVYFNRTNLVVKVSNKFQQWGRITQSYRLSEVSIPLQTMVGLEYIQQTLLEREDDETSVSIVIGDWCLVGWRTGSRELYRVSTLTSTLASSSQDAFMALPIMQAQFDRLLDAKFANVMM